MDNPKADRPERRTALVARELARYHIDIAALSKTRRANERQLTEDGGGYCVFWSGRTSEERREAGVGFVIMSHLVSKLASLPRGLNDRLMVMQLQLTNKQKATLISAYAPTMTNPEEVKDQFYEQLDALIAAVPKSEKLITLGDFNARVGTDYHTWSGDIGQQGTGKCNSNGLILLQICTTHELVITNTLFGLPTRSKTLKALASDWLCYHKEERCKWRQSDKVNVWGRVLDGPQTLGVKSQTTHPATKTTSREETYQEAKCQQA